MAWKRLHLRDKEFDFFGVHLPCFIHGRSFTLGLPTPRVCFPLAFLRDCWTYNGVSDRFAYDDRSFEAISFRRWENCLMDSSIPWLEISKDEIQDFKFRQPLQGGIVSFEMNQISIRCRSMILLTLWRRQISISAVQFFPKSTISRF